MAVFIVVTGGTGNTGTTTSTRTPLRMLTGLGMSLLIGILGSLLAFGMWL